VLLHRRCRREKALQEPLTPSQLIEVKSAIGVIYTEMGEYDKAMGWLSLATEELDSLHLQAGVSPDVATSCRYHLGIIFMAMAPPQAAQRGIEAFDKCVQGDSGNLHLPHAHNNKGIILRDRLGRAEDAAAAFQAAITAKEDFYEAHVNLAMTLHRHLGTHYEEALQHYHFVMEVRPAEWFVCLNAALLLAEMERHSEAEEMFLQHLQHDQFSLPAHYHLALSQKALQRREDAKHSLRSAIRIEPNCGEAHIQLAKLLLEDEEYDLTETHLREAIRIDTDDYQAQDEAAGTTYFQLAVLLGTLMSPPLAKEAMVPLMTAVKREPYNVQYRMLFVKLLQMDGRCDEAQAQLEQAVLRAPAQEEKLRKQFAIFQTEYPAGCSDANNQGAAYS